MIISSPFDFFKKNYFLKHYRLSLMGGAYKFIWRPRFGWQRRFITNPLMRIFNYWRSSKWSTNKFYLQLNHYLGEIKIIIYSKDMQLAPSPKNFEYGPEPDLQLLLRALSPDILGFYDVGANFGFFSLFLASLKSFEGRCYAFEPTPNSYENLNAIVNEFDLDGRIETINAALSNRSGDLLMNLPIETHSGYAKVVSIDDLNTYKVSSKSLDEWVVAEEKIAPTFIKIDVEGHELEVLLGADKTIASHRPYIYFENGNTLERHEHKVIYDFFENHGYILFIPTWMYVKNDLWSTCRIPVNGVKNHLALISIKDFPEVMYDRSLFMVLNIFACPKERIKELTNRLHAELDL